MKANNILEPGMSETTEAVDLNALKFNQILIVAFAVLGFILDQPVIPACVAAVLILGAIKPAFSLFRLVYKLAILPLKLMDQLVVPEKAGPHRFAQLLGGTVLGIAAAFLYAGFPTVGWSLTWAVILLASLNILIGFCAGCFLYLQLSRLAIFGGASARERRAQ